MKIIHFFFQCVRRSVLMIGMLVAPIAASAQTPQTGADALALALADPRLPVTDSMKIETIDAVLHRLNPDPQWEFLFRDGDMNYRVKVSAGRDVEVRETTARDRALPAFFASLPPIQELETPEIYLELAKDAWMAEDARVNPRPEYIIAYGLCSPERGGASCASITDPKQTWQVVLRADVEGADGTIVRSIGFEDGGFAGIEDVRIGGNW